MQIHGIEDFSTHPIPQRIRIVADLAVLGFLNLFHHGRRKIRANQRARLREARAKLVNDARHNWARAATVIQDTCGGCKREARVQALEHDGNRLHVQAACHALVACRFLSPIFRGRCWGDFVSVYPRMAMGRTNLRQAFWSMARVGLLKRGCLFTIKGMTWAVTLYRTWREHFDTSGRPLPDLLRWLSIRRISGLDGDTGTRESLRVPADR